MPKLDVVTRTVVPSFARYLSENHGALGLSWTSKHTDGSSTTYVKKDPSDPTGKKMLFVFRADAEEDKSTTLYVPAQVPPTETPAWLVDLLEGYKEVLNQWSSDDICKVTIKYYYG